jgi:antitoxin component of MazEF toxin-antitoxin module
VFIRKIRGQIKNKCLSLQNQKKISMTATVLKSGNNLAVKFPKIIGDNVRISENDNVEIWVHNNIIMIKRQETARQHFSTKERIARFANTHSKLNSAPQEFDWGKEKGEEIW